MLIASKVKSEAEKLRGIISSELAKGDVAIEFYQFDDNYLESNEILIEHRGDLRWFRVYFRDADDYNKLSYVFQSIGNNEIIRVLSLYVPSVTMYKYDLISIFNEWVIAGGEESVISGYLSKFE